jgi:hypothetical protein
MEITVKIPDQLAVQAETQGLPVEEYVQSLLAKFVEASSLSSSFPKTEAEIRVWLESMTRFSDKIPPLPEIISREWIYQ